ncbi:hypothetical protein [Streptomyces sp. NPDC053431]|uniref:hypothetical protein n=1 Tax=Streptomyces sp. NPDC053431 TaxID=3365703 RepID=UPI0037CD8288
MSEEEALRLFGKRHPTRQDLTDLSQLPVDRWHGRSTVPFDAAGHPQEILFWGCSGD